MMGRYASIVGFTLIFLASYLVHCNSVSVGYDNRALTIDGKRRILLSGAIHYPRSTPEMWPSLIRKAKEGGLDAIETYVFWSEHEPRPREYFWTGQLDLVRFLKTVQAEGLYAILRIGPYVCAEFNNGGVPVWLHNMGNVTFRTKDPVFMNEMQRFVSLVVHKMKVEKLFAPQGGPIILAQIENEYGNAEWKFGADGKVYLNWCASMAQSLNIGVPWIMCQQDDAPDYIIPTVNGYYGHQWYPKNKNVPKIWTENWVGWYKNWGSADPHRTAEDIAFAVARFFQLRGTVQNYYMYHGGTNFKRYGGGPFIATTYDYDAPIDEYGLLNEPKWGHLKELHQVLKSYEQVLTYGNFTDHDYGNAMSSTVYEYEGKRLCIFGNSNGNMDIPIIFEGTAYTTPAWSVSFLDDCKNEIYNTARVNAQKTVKAKVPNAYQRKLNWEWRPEKIEQNDKRDRGITKTTRQLLEQKSVTDDSTDYLWYLTSLNIGPNDPLSGTELTLHVGSHGHVLHAFVNGKHIGSKINGGDFVFEASTDQFRVGTNKISLLSGTVGLANYEGQKWNDPHYDLIPTGISGPVKVTAPNSEEKDLSLSLWSYKVGLDGMKQGFFDGSKRNGEWLTSQAPKNQPFVWYKTHFDAPVGDDPVVVDLLGMGKGVLWVNGHNLGRYIPSFKAWSDKGCTDTCDYRGEYGDKKCRTNCGNSSQRWYHVPREYLFEGRPNTLVLFEEIGGNIHNVNIQTVTVSKVSGNVFHGKTLNLTCHGKKISKINFASYGNPESSSESFEKGSCHFDRSSAIVAKHCVGKQSCSIDVSEKTFGHLHCATKPKLAVEAEC